MSEPNLTYFQRLQLIKIGKLPKEAIAKKKQPLKKISVKRAKEVAEEKEARGGDATDQQKWYTKIMDSEEPKCWETGEKLNRQDKLGWHGSVAHCLPKAIFPSVATHPMNYMILSMWNGSHANYDRSWESAAKMKVWPYALKIIIGVLLPCLPPEEKRKLPDVILQEIDPLKKNIQ